MAFKGTLDTLSMIDVFQVISMARKAGCLVVHQPDGDTKRLYFEGGAIISATSTCSKDRLGAVLIKMGLLSQEQVDASRQDEVRTGQKQGQTLIAQGLLGEEALNGALVRQVAEICYSVMGWRVGAFEFLDEEHPAADVFRVHESVTHVILQGTRQLDEWRLIEKAFPDLDAVVSMRPPRTGSGDIHLQADDWQILTLVDGRRSLREICALSNLTNFDVCRKLLALHDAGLVATGAPRAPGSLRPPSAAPPARAPEIAPAPTATRVVSARFFPAVRAQLTRYVGPIAEVILDEATDSLRIPIDKLPLHRVAELARLLCDEIDAPDKRDHFREFVLRASQD